MNMTVNELGYTWRGRLVINVGDPVEAWACPECGALVATGEQLRHSVWHDDTRTAGAP